MRFWMRWCCCGGAEVQNAPVTRKKNAVIVGHTQGGGKALLRAGVAARFVSSSVVTGQLVTSSGGRVVARVWAALATARPLLVTPLRR